MRVIVEGPDNAGKSTLCSRLAAITGRTLVASGGREVSPEEIIERSLLLLAKPDFVIHDRHCIISQPIYGQAVCPNTPIPDELTDQLYAQEPLFIYCRARVERGMDDHVATERDTAEYVDTVTAHYEDLVWAYDEWALGHAHIIYRIGQPVQPIINYLKET